MDLGKEFNLLDKEAKDAIIRDIGKEISTAAMLAKDRQAGLVSDLELAEKASEIEKGLDFAIDALLHRAEMEANKITCEHCKKEIYPPLSGFHPEIKCPHCGKMTKTGQKEKKAICEICGEKFSTSEINCLPISGQGIYMPICQNCRQEGLD